MKTLLFCAIGIFLLMTSHLSRADIKLSNDFLQAIKDSGMRFDPPHKDYNSVAVRENTQLKYQLAIRSKIYNMEVRYAIHPTVTEGGGLGSLMYFRTVIANIAQSDNPFSLPHEEFKQTDVQTEFNADWGASSIFPAKPSFAAPFDYCNLVHIHKDGRGSAFIIYLFNQEDANTVLPEMLRIFYVLRFK